MTGMSTNGATREIRQLRRTLYGQALLGDPCPYCGVCSEVLDHVTARAVGGADVADNIVGACAGCNKRKGPRSLLGFLLAQRVEAEPPPVNLGDELVRLMGLDRAVAEWRAATRRCLP